ncbi:uncharacterized protein [Medicago truncatula]|uniref:uncharacterized protein n=1 Tax=Medicago truncatula TaxID=3880 RepID=UPI000D2F1B19|nr:uncharacterized protein LOC112422103 [Medicago truncatula]
MVTMSGHASNGHCLPTTFDISHLDRFHISPFFRCFKDIEMIVWKPPTHPYIKVNTNHSLHNSNAACGRIFRDQYGAFMGGFSANIGVFSVFEAEIMRFIISIEMAARHHWRFLWIEGDSTSALFAFSMSSLIPIRWRNRWHNCFSLGMQVFSSHIFCEGNGCTDKLSSHDHLVTDVV